MARFLLDPETAVARYKSLQHLGEVWYNLKTNPEVGGILEKMTDAKFVATGLGNLSRVDPRRAVMLVQGETRQELGIAADSGVHGFIVDNEPDLKNVLDVADDTRLFLRLRMKEHSLYTGKYFVYGMDWRRAVPLVRGMDRVGIHFHRKTQNVGEWSLVDDLSPILKEMEGHVSEVNVGGGLPVEYHNSKPRMGPIMANLEALRDNLRSRGVGLVLEPGRYVAAPAVKLETRIINAYGRNLVVDASIYNASMDTFLFNIRLPVEGETHEGHRYLLKGRSPDSLDIFRYKVFFGGEKRVGENITFLNAGAYNFHTEFSDLPRIPTVIS
jgi:ornithine decarboxylase